MGEQLVEKVKLLSNKAECCLRTEAWGEADSAASLALRIDTKHAKSLLRHARQCGFVPHLISPHLT